MKLCNVQDLIHYTFNQIGHEILRRHKER